MVMVITMKFIILRKKSVNSFFCNVLIFRSSRSQIFFKIEVLKKVSQESNCVGASFLKKPQALRSATLLKRDSNSGVFL